MLDFAVPAAIPEAEMAEVSGEEKTSDENAAHNGENAVHN
jgi:hypothetical protein